MIPGGHICLLGARFLVSMWWKVERAELWDGRQFTSHWSSQLPFGRRKEGQGLSALWERRGRADRRQGSNPDGTPDILLKPWTRFLKPHSRDLRPSPSQNQALRSHHGALSSGRHCSYTQILSSAEVSLLTVHPFYILTLQKLPKTYPSQVLNSRHLALWADSHVMGTSATAGP